MTEERPRTLHVGTEADGFRVTHTPGGSELRLECWGYWDAQTCHAFTRHAGAALEKLALPVVLILDAALLKPQAAEGQDALRAFLKRVACVSHAAARVLATNVLVRMQLIRLAREADLELAFASRPTSLPPQRSL